MTYQERNEWLKSIKVGDTVGVWYGGISAVMRSGVIDRETPTQWDVSGFGKFKKASGMSVGTYSRYSLEPYDPDHESILRLEQKLISERAQQLRSKGILTRKELTEFSEWLDKVEKRMSKEIEE